MPKTPDFPDTAPDELRPLPDTKDAVRYPKGAQVVRALLERHGIKRSQHVLVVSKIFGLGKSAAHYRLTGGTAWSWEDIEALANALGSSLNEVLSAELRSSTLPEFEAPVLAAVRQWTFHPAIKAGVPVESRVMVPVQLD